MTSRTDTGPFALTPEWVLDADVSDRAKVLYAVLGRYADDKSGECWPSRSTLAERLRCSPDSLDRAKTELQRIGALDWSSQTRDDGGLTSNRYRLLRVEPSAPERSTSRTAADTPIRTAAATRTRPNKERESENARALSLVVEQGTAKKEPYEDEFNRVWSVYPRKTARKRALRAYQATRRRGVPAVTLSAAVFAYAAARKGQDAEFTLHGSTFFGPDERWRDFDPVSTAADALVGQLDAPDLAAMEKRAAAGPQTGTKYRHVAPWQSE